MKEIILYPTETIYGLGVNVFDEEAWLRLCALKNRPAAQPASWLVRSVDDIEKYAEVTDKARLIIDKYLPGPLTIVLQAKHLTGFGKNEDETIGFRISSDLKAQSLISDYMKKNNAPLTCTSANLHGQKTNSTVSKILAQFGSESDQITTVIDDGERYGKGSTIVRCIGETVEILREGTIKPDDILI